MQSYTLVSLWQPAVELFRSVICVYLAVNLWQLSRMVVILVIKYFRLTTGRLWVQLLAVPLSCNNSGQDIAMCAM